MRRILVAVGLAVSLAASLAPAHSAEFEPEGNRPGSDYHNFTLRAPDPNTCKRQCDSDGRCVAWTYVKPGYQGPAARCWLKHSVPNLVGNACCVSGTKGATQATPIATGMEAESNRPGSDYRSFNLGVPDPQICKRQCDSEGQCASWTYVKPGIQGTQARCWLKHSVPNRRNDGCCVSGVRAGPTPVPLPPPPLPLGPGMEADSNRPGSDYRNFTLAAPDPQICKAQCDAEGQCASWTYVKPGYQGAQARCWLKHAVPNRQSNACCVSGVRAAPAVAAGMEAGTNRPGGDYRYFDLRAPDPQQCKAQCEVEQNCRAWTYVNPGLQGPAARCWLKNVVPAARADGCCVSGLVTHAAAPPPPQAQGDACNVDCDKMCRARGRPGGRYTGGICLLGVRTSDSTCTCQ